MHRCSDARRRFMLFSRVNNAIRLLPVLVFAMLLGAVPAALCAQDTTSAPAAPQPAQRQAINLVDYSKPRSAFPRVLQPYMGRELAQPNIGNSPRIDSLMRDGKIYLS